MGLYSTIDPLVVEQMVKQWKEEDGIYFL